MNFTRFALFTALAFSSAAAASARSYAAYKGAIVIDAASGRVLFEDNADAVSPPASMTKLMTFAVLNDRIRAGALSLQTRVVIVPADQRAAPSIIDLKPREVFPIVELVYAMMLHSANDAALAVAREVGGSVPGFVRLMNEKARALGMNHTTFRSPNGLPPPSRRISDGDLTTPRDFAILCRYLVLNTDILRYTSVKNRLFGVNSRFPPTPMLNHNHLLGRIQGVDGLKTGYTAAAGSCLSATALRNGRRIIVVMMDSPDAKSRDLRVAELIDRGFATAAIIQSVRPVDRPTRPATAAATPADPSEPVIRFVVPR